MTNPRLLITGSRDWTDEGRINDALLMTVFCYREAFGDQKITLVSGACPNGADAIAEKIAELHPLIFDIERHPADWETHGKRAGFVRNAEMVKLGAVACLAFIRKQSKGATMTADLAEKAGIDVFRYIQVD